MKKGFTLVELLAVIIILGLVVAITVPVVRGTVEKQRYEQFKISVEGFVNAINEDVATDEFTLPRRYEYKVIDNKRDLYYITSGDAIPLQISGTLKYKPTAKFVINEDNQLIVYVESDRYCAAKRAVDDEILYGEKVENEEGEIHCLTEDKDDLADYLNAVKNI
jgi:prepilin-type N-terminal cleavage/methylation domain-containing protein